MNVIKVYDIIKELIKMIFIYLKMYIIFNCVQCHIFVNPEQ